MRIETKLGISEYMEVVAEIVAGNFDDDGSYTPHIGRVAEMESFFNHCVKDYTGEIEEQSADNPYPIDGVFSDAEFISAYNSAVRDVSCSAINYGNARLDALKIVEDRKSNIGRAVSMISSFVEKYFTPDNMARLFGESNRFQEIANGENVVSFVENAISNQ